LQGRLHEIAWEIDVYKKTGNPNGHSLTQRFEYWKTATRIIKNNLLFGVGTGDLGLAFQEEYNKSNSVLEQRWRLRSHNQYLSIAVGMGIIGLLWFLLTLFYPMFKLNMQSNFLYLSFFVIAIVSFLTEDTLETQAGVTFFAAFNSYFLFLQPQQKKNE
jgi:O-antigen ligase